MHDCGDYSDEDHCFGIIICLHCFGMIMCLQANVKAILTNKASIERQICRLSRDI